MAALKSRAGSELVSPWAAWPTRNTQLPASQLQIQRGRTLPSLMLPLHQDQGGQMPRGQVEEFKAAQHARSGARLADAAPAGAALAGAVQRRW